MSRLPYPDMAALSAEKKEKIGWPERPVLNITRMALHAPDEIWRSHFAMKLAAVKSTQMDPGLREVLILRTACLARSAHEREVANRSATSSASKSRGSWRSKTSTA